MPSLLEIINLHVAYPGKKSLWKKEATIQAVTGVHLHVDRGEIVALVGESGSGKSTVGRSVVGLAPVSCGEIMFNGSPLAPRHRTQVQMVFQDPYASLNPRMKVLSILCDPLVVNKLASLQKAKEIALELATQVGLAPDLLERYPHQLSGGQRQRVAVARALALKPQLIIADEVVSALDVSIQAQIINLFSDLRKQRNLAMLFISHDLSVVRHLADRVAVMHAGKIVEMGPCKDVYENPRHPYTQKLLSSVLHFSESAHKLAHHTEPQRHTPSAA